MTASSSTCFSRWHNQISRLFSASPGRQDELTGILTIRNLTSHRLTISQAENVYTAAAFGNARRRVDQQNLIDQGHTGEILEPFSTNSTVTEDRKTDLEVADMHHFDAEQHKTTPLYSSNGLSPLQTEHITAIYDKANHFLTLYEAPNLSCWMKDFRDDTSVAALSIPGTHNSPTCHWALPSVRCQAVSPLEQLNNGVRFFDVRVQPANSEDPTSDIMYLVHGAFPTTLFGYQKFRDLVNTIESFLHSHPSETLMMSVKREGIGRATDQQLADILATHYAQDWYTDPAIPTLGQARGKIVLLRRYGLSERLRNANGGRGWALDAESWEDNTASCVHGQVCVQDFYEVLNTKLIPKKLEVSCAQFERAGAVVCPVPDVQASQGSQLLYLNFLTASNFFNPRCWPENIAKKLNPEVTAFLCQKHDCGDTGAGQQPSSHGDGGLGIVVCDWVGRHGDWDLVKCIIGMNSRRLVRERGHGWT